MKAAGPSQDAVHYVSSPSCVGGSAGGARWGLPAARRWWFGEWGGPKLPPLPLPPPVRCTLPLPTGLALMLPPLVLTLVRPSSLYSELRAVPATASPTAGWNSPARAGCQRPST